MSLEGLTTLLTDISERRGLAQQVASDPAAIGGYDLNADEREALLADDPERLRELGVPDELVPVAELISRRDP